MKHHVVLKNKNTQLLRIFYIDILRGLAIFFMVFLHTSIYYIQEKFIYILFNLTDFVNVAFLFCSCFIFFGRDKKGVKMLHWPSVKRRLLKLILPYYIFLIFYFILVYFMERASFNLINIIKHIIMWNGIYISWLVILFIIFTFLNPIVFFLKRNNRLLFYLFFIISLASSIAFLFFKIKNFAYVLWIPYSLTTYYVIWIRKFMKNKAILFYALVIMSILFAFLFFIRDQQNQAFLLANKYPPNIYYLLYSFIVFDVFFLMLKFNLIYKNKIISKFFIYLGKNSYDLFFIHILLIFLLNKSAFFTKINWLASFTIVLLLSLIAQFIIHLFLIKFVKIGVLVNNK